MGRSFMYHATVPKGRIVDDEQVPALEAEGWVDTPAKLHTLPPPAPPAQPETDVAREELLRTAVGALDPDNPEHFTKGGLPRVEALEAVSGIIDVTREERDAAWAAVQ